MTKPISLLTNNWTLLLKFGGAIASSLLAFLIFPNLYEYADRPDLSVGNELTTFLIACICGITTAFLPPKNFDIRVLRKRVLWLFGLSILLFASYRVTLSQITEQYSKWTTVVGSTMLPEAQIDYKARLKKAGRPIGIREYIMINVGRTNQIWPESELQFRRFLLIILYILCTASITVFTVVMLHMVKRAP